MGNLYWPDSGKLISVMGKLAEAGFTPEMLEAVETDPTVAQAMVEAARKSIEATGHNPFEQTVEEQIAALRRANAEEGWGIPDEVIATLTATAPAWPKGRDSYRSFRIRFGMGDDGVLQTCERHAVRIEHVLGDKKCWRSNHIRTIPECMRLLVGNHTHTPTVEWVSVQLDANRQRTTIAHVRGPKSLADEGLVLAWLFPKRVEAIDHDQWTAWFCAGYELNVPEQILSWQNVLYMSRNCAQSQTQLSSLPRYDSYHGNSVPVLQE